MLIVLESECLEFIEEIEHLSEKQEVLATKMERRQHRKTIRGTSLRSWRSRRQRSAGTRTKEAQVDQMGM